MTVPGLGALHTFADEDRPVLLTLRPCDFHPWVPISQPYTVERVDFLPCPDCRGWNRITIQGRTYIPVLYEWQWESESGECAWGISKGWQEVAS